MAIVKSINFEGKTYRLGQTRRVAAQVALKETGVTTNYRVPVVTLVDQAGATAIRSAIQTNESGTIFTVPALTSGTQTLDLPAVGAGTVGCIYHFVMIDTAGQDFNVQGAGSDKILAAAPDGAGNNTGISAGKDSIGFDATAVEGSFFSVVGITSTAATGWQAINVIDGLAANVGSINLA